MKKLKNGDLESTLEAAFKKAKKAPKKNPAKPYGIRIKEEDLGLLRGLGLSPQDLFNKALAALKETRKEAIEKKTNFLD